MKLVLLIGYSDKKIIFRKIQLNSGPVNFGGQKFWPPKLTKN